MICTKCGNETDDEDNCAGCRELRMQTHPQRRSQADRDREVKERKLSERAQRDEQVVGAIYQDVEKNPVPVALIIAVVAIVIAIAIAVFMQTNSESDTVGLSYESDAIVTLQEEETTSL